MILFILADVKEIAKKGRDYPWSKPDKCPKCGDYNVWGHGFVERCFDNFNHLLLIKRYRCPSCGCVICYRPIDFFKRFQATVQTIKSCITSRLILGKWNPHISKSRQRHWLNALRRRTIAFFGNTYNRSLIDAFDDFSKMGQIPISRSL